MPERDYAALRDVHWKMYQENWTQARHHENQRSELAKALIGVAGAAIAIISLKTGLVLKDLPLTVFVFLLGGFGAVFSAKQYERVRFHLERAAAHCEELNELLPGSPLGALEDRVDEHHNHIFPWLGALRLNLFWTGLYVCIAAIGLGLSAVAIFWPSEYLAQPRSTVPPFDLRR
jgi:hypothetical protein